MVTIFVTICLLIKKRDRGIFNVGSDEFFSNIQIAKSICKILNKNPKEFVKFVKDRPYNDKRYSISSNKIHKLGWKIQHKLMDDLPEIIDWYKNNIRLFKNFGF